MKNTSYRGSVRLTEPYSDKESYSSPKALCNMDELEALWVKINHIKWRLLQVTYWKHDVSGHLEILDNAFKCIFKVNSARVFIIMIPSLVGNIYT